MSKWRINSRYNLLIYTGGIIWVLVLTYFIHYNYSHSERSLIPISTPKYDAFSESENDTPSKYDIKQDHTFLLLQQRLNSAPGSEMYGSTYEKIFKNHKLSSIVGNLDLNQRCNLYFKNLFIENNDWLLDPHTDLDVHFDRNDFEDYLAEFREELEQEFKKRLYLPKEKEEYEKKLAEFIRDKYKLYKLPEFERKMVDMLTTFRIFNQCYLNNPTSSKQFISDQKQFLNKVGNIEPFQEVQSEKLADFSTSESFEHRVYPWLSFEYPVYEHWSGATFYKPPNLKNLNFRGKTQKPPKDARTGPKSQFLHELKSLSNGRGIVLTMPEHHVDTTVNLIHLLRALHNKLPIQIINTDDISKAAKRKLVAAAQDDFISLPKSFEKVSASFPPGYIVKDGGLPKQEVWFVNAHNTINELYRDKFRSYSNKFIAILFNSFEEFMLIDDDTVMMKNPEFFFNLKGFQETGAFFYKDRTSPERRAISDGVLFQKLAPSVVDSIMFDIPVMSEYTTGREFFKGLYHYQEAGMILFNKVKHFSSLLMITQISFYGPIHGKMWGDKEFFWLGFAINGDESYAFNDNFAAAIGELTASPGERHRPDGSSHRSQELCSPHPGQISDEDGHTLLWINSGFRYCHQADEVDFEEEFTRGSRLKFLKDFESFKAFYYAPLIIKQAVIPPLREDLQGSGNIQDEPNHGWIMEGYYCRRYLWCAYSSVGGETSHKQDTYLEGTIVNFTEDEQNLFKYYGDIWVGQE